MAKSTRKAKDGKAQQQLASQRKVIVFLALLTVMTGTGALLLALAPAPLPAGASSVLFAAGTPDSLDPVFTTSVPVQSGRWKYIYIHHTATAAGNAATLGELPGGLPDHFVIGNGDGCGDGEVQIAQRWHRQAGAGQVGGLTLKDDCITISVVGDFERSLPTNTQMLRLNQLVTALQDRCGIPAANVHPTELSASNRNPQLTDRMTASAGVGRYFPIAKLREALLP